MLGAVVPTYNIPGRRADLKFTPGHRWPASTWAASRNGTIKVIAADNPGVKFPSERHRRGAPLRWQRHDLRLDRLPVQGQPRNGRAKSGAGTSVSWPVGLGGQGNEGVAGLVKQTPDSIGYVELVYAVQNKLAYASIKNSAGEFVKAKFRIRDRRRRRRGREHAGGFPGFHHQRPGKGAYPISSFTWLLIPAILRMPPRRKPSRTS